MEKTPKQKLLARLHILATQKCFTHEDLHNVVVECGKTSLTECTEEQLQKFINWLGNQKKKNKSA